MSVQINLQIIDLNNKKYYLSTDLVKHDPAFFAGCHTNTRFILSKKKLSPDNYVFAYEKKNDWILSHEKYPRAKLLLHSSWVETHVPKIAIKKKGNNPSSCLSSSSDIKTVHIDLSDEIDISDLYDIPPAPRILKLKEEEKFVGIDGKTLDIEVRGERESEKCFFKVKDVSEAFEMPNLYVTLIHKDKGYTKNIHYKYFTIEKLTIGQKEQSKKELYLTYNGVLKVLFNSRTGNAENFQKWASKTLFTIQLGKKEEKQKLASNLLGVHVNVVKQVFNKNISTIPCIYLLSLNTVANLRFTFNIPTDFKDDMIVCKYGCTEDIERRIKEHQTAFGKLENVNLELTLFSYIDPKYIFDAESNISNYFYKYKLDSDKFDELVIIDQKDMKNIRKQYEMVQQAFCGHVKELLIKMKDLETKLKEDNLNFQLTLKNKDIEILELKYDNQLLSRENAFIKRELELLNRINELVKN